MGNVQIQWRRRNLLTEPWHSFRKVKSSEARLILTEIQEAAMRSDTLRGMEYRIKPVLRDRNRKKLPIRLLA